MSQDLVTSATSQSMIGSRLGGPGAIGSGMSITGSQSSHIGAVSSAGGAVADSGGTGSSHFNQQHANGQHKRGIQTSPDGNNFTILEDVRNLFFIVLYKIWSASFIVLH